MDLTRLKQIPPWDWPDNAGASLLRILQDHRSAPSDRLAAAELAGEITVIDDRVAAQLLSIVQSAGEPEETRARAASNWGLDAAWPHVRRVLTSRSTEKELLLDAIGAAALIRPSEAEDILTDLADSDDEEIAEAASNALLERDSGEFNDEEDPL